MQNAAIVGAKGNIKVEQVRLFIKTYICLGSIVHFVLFDSKIFYFGSFDTQKSLKHSTIFLPLFGPK